MSGEYCPKCRGCLGLGVANVTPRFLTSCPPSPSPLLSPVLISEDHSALQSSPSPNHNVWHKAGAGAVSGLVAPPLAAAGWSLCLTVSGAAAAVLPGCWLAHAATAEAAPHSSISIRPPTKYFSEKIFIQCIFFL